MRPSSGDRICGQLQIDEDAAADLGGHAFGPTLHASLPPEGDGEGRLWLTVIERSLVPSQVDVSSFMARMGELLDSEQPGLVPIRLVDREADFCVVGYQAMPGAVPLQRRIEGAGSTAGLVARVAVEVARGLAHLHRKGRVHGALAPGNIVLWQEGVALWQHGLTLACNRKAVAPQLRALGGDVVAPEVRAGKAPTSTSDVYAWGAVIAALATDTVGSAALAAVEDGELAAGLLTDIIVGALSAEVDERPVDGLAVLRLIADAPVVEGSGGAAAARQAELRELAGRYVDEVEGKSTPVSPPAAKKKRDPSKRRQFRRTATELYPPDLAPVAGEMIAPDEPEPDPFTVSTDAVAPAEVVREEPEHVPTPAPMQITARRIEDEPNRHFNPDALTPPDGARLSELEPGPESPPLPSNSVSPGGVSLPPLVGRPGDMDDGFAPNPTPVPTPPPSPDAQTPTPAPLPARPPIVAPTLAPVSPPPRASSAPIPPPPQHDDMSAEDSGFGLSLPVAETLDSRISEDDGFQGVVGALAAAESSPRLATLDGAPAEPNPALSRGPALELDLPARPEKPGAKATAIGRLPPRAPAKSVPPPKLEAGAGRGSGPSAGKPGLTPGSRPGLTTAQKEAAKNSSDAMAPVVPPGGKIQLDVQSARVSTRSRSAQSDPGRRRPDVSGVRLQEAPAEARGPRGSIMAALFGFGATIIAVSLTVPVAQERGGLSVLLGTRTPEEAADTSDPDGSPDGSPDGDAPNGKQTPVQPPSTCPDDTASLPGSAKVCIDVGEHPGLREIPTTGATLAEATLVCEAQGRRLCTQKEWRKACRGETGRRQPYGGSRKDGHCNDALRGVPQNLGRGGARETCVTPEGVYDLVGNVGEWVEGGAVMGGDATTHAASCTTRRKPGKSTQDPAIGFRCCVTLVDAPDDKQSH